MNKEILEMMNYIKMLTLNIQSGGILKNKIKKKYVPPFTNVEIKNNNNNNSGFRLVRSQNNQTKNCNFKESVGSCEI